ncbi:hypothetical protein [Pseudomonas sp. NA-150]|uniref:hypothetical protein n=1 Tax=Pseudomonas sp. NA-150 TaxID=3367525 RepID=UPI0037CC18F6
MFERSLFDARIVEVTADNHLVLDYQGSARRVRLAEDQELVPGNIGFAMCIDQTLKAYVFRSYIDQSLRRKPELDRFSKPTTQQIRLGVLGNEWGWRNNRHPQGFRSPSEITPGVDGSFEPIQCQLLRLDVPREFIAFCRQYGCSPEAMLKSFIADTLQFQTNREKPRVDHYQKHASFAFDAVQTYLDRAHGWKKEQAQ